MSSLLKTFGPLTPEQLVPLGLEVASALAYMHASGYVHLDVKPRNVILSAMPRLIDLGLARPIVEARDISYVVGTDAYMAPEQSEANGAALGPPADVWGLGATLYTCAAGRRPFPTGTDEVPYPQLTMDPRPMDSKRVSEPIQKIILGMLVKDPAARPTADAVAAELEGLVEEARLVARRRLRARFRR
jgi:serine/threonine protein kinase